MDCFCYEIPLVKKSHNNILLNICKNFSIISILFKEESNMSKAIDINKNTIMEMLRTDVFGFRPSDIESQAKEVFHLVSGDDSSAANHPGGYARNKSGFIVISTLNNTARGGKKMKK